MSIVSILELRVKECEEHNALLQRENDCNHKQLCVWRNRLIRADDRVAEMEKEVARLKGEREKKHGTFVPFEVGDQVDSSFSQSPCNVLGVSLLLRHAPTDYRFHESPEQCSPCKREPEEKKCGCGACVYQPPLNGVNVNPWTYYLDGLPRLAWANGHHCPDCGEELKA